MRVKNLLSFIKRNTFRLIDLSFLLFLIALILSYVFSAATLPYVEQGIATPKVEYESYNLDFDVDRTAPAITDFPSLHRAVTGDQILLDINITDLSTRNVRVYLDSGYLGRMYVSRNGEGFRARKVIQAPYQGGNHSLALQVEDWSGQSSTKASVLNLTPSEDVVPRVINVHAERVEMAFVHANNGTGADVQIEGPLIPDEAGIYYLPVSGFGFQTRGVNYTHEGRSYIRNISYYSTAGIRNRTNISLSKMGPGGTYHVYGIEAPLYPHDLSLSYGNITVNGSLYIDAKGGMESRYWIYESYWGQGTLCVKWPGLETSFEVAINNLNKSALRLPPPILDGHIQELGEIQLDLDAVKEIRIDNSSRLGTLEEGHHNIYINASQSQVQGLYVYFITPFKPYLVSLTPLYGEGAMFFYTPLVFILLLGAISLIIRNGYPSLKQLSQGLGKGTGLNPMGNNALYATFLVFSAILSFSLTYNIILASLGINIQVPGFGSLPLWRRILSLVTASVWEEVISRVVYIGLPLTLLAGLNIYPKGEKRLSIWKYLTGGGVRITLPRLILLLFSSILFGIAHIPSWDVYKFIPSLVAGLGFGYLYLRYGLASAISAHLALDTFTLLPPIINIYFGPGTATVSYLFVMTVILLSLLFGSLFMGYFSYMGLLYTGLIKNRFSDVLRTRAKLDRAVAHLPKLAFVLLLGLIVYMLSTPGNASGSILVSLAARYYIYILYGGAVVLLAALVFDAVAYFNIKGKKPMGIGYTRSRGAAVILFVLAGIMTLPIGYLLLASAYPLYRGLKSDID